MDELLNLMDEATATTSCDDNNSVKKIKSNKGDDAEQQQQQRLFSSSSTTMSQRFDSTRRHRYAAVSPSPPPPHPLSSTTKKTNTNNDDEYDNANDNNNNDSNKICPYSNLFIKHRILSNEQIQDMTMGLDCFHPSILATMSNDSIGNGEMATVALVTNCTGTKVSRSGNAYTIFTLGTIVTNSNKWSFNGGVDFEIVPLITLFLFSQAYSKHNGKVKVGDVILALGMSPLTSASSPQQSSFTTGNTLKSFKLVQEDQVHIVGIASEYKDAMRQEQQQKQQHRGTGKSSDNITNHKNKNIGWKEKDVMTMSRTRFHHNNTNQRQGVMRCAPALFGDTMASTGRGLPSLSQPSRCAALHMSRATNADAGAGSFGGNVSKSSSFSSRGGVSSALSRLSKTTKTSGIDHLRRTSAANVAAAAGTASRNNNKALQRLFGDFDRRMNDKSSSSGVLTTTSSSTTNNYSNALRDPRQQRLTKNDNSMKPPSSSSLINNNDNNNNKKQLEKHHDLNPHTKKLISTTPTRTNTNKNETYKTQTKTKTTQLVSKTIKKRKLYHDEEDEYDGSVRIPKPCNTLFSRGGGGVYRGGSSSFFSSLSSIHTVQRQRLDENNVYEREKEEQQKTQKILEIQRQLATEITIQSQEGELSSPSSSSCNVDGLSNMTTHGKAAGKASLLPRHKSSSTSPSSSSLKQCPIKQGRDNVKENNCVNSSNNDKLSLLFGSNNSNHDETRESIMNAKSIFHDHVEATNYAKSVKIVNDLERKEAYNDAKNKKKTTKQKGLKSHHNVINCSTGRIITGYKCMTCGYDGLQRPMSCIHAHHQVKKTRRIDNDDDFGSGGVGGNINIGTRNYRLHKLGSKKIGDVGLQLGSGLEWSGWNHSSS